MSLYEVVKHQWIEHAHDILDMKIHVLDMPNCKKSMNMHNMNMSPLICDTDKELSKSFPSKTNIQIVLLLNQTKMNHLIVSITMLLLLQC
jgi:hypothetical protein